MIGIVILVVVKPFYQAAIMHQHAASVLLAESRTDFLY